jgi:hypothetical protein
MQVEASDAVDISKETEATERLHGISEGLSDDFGRKCLLARRLVERVFHFIHLYSGTHLGNDQDGAHNDLTARTKMAAKTDKRYLGPAEVLKARVFPIRTWSFGAASSDERR